MSRSRALLGATGLALAVLGSACGPPLPLEIGVKDRATDVVYGSQKKPEPPKPAPLAALDPGFPSFIVAPPVPAPLAPAAVKPVVKLKCPTAGPFDFPAEPVTSGIPKLPLGGRYHFRQQGSTTIDGKPAAPLTPEIDRVITNIVKENDTSFSYDQVIEQGGMVTTTTYRVLKTTDNSELDGLYLTRVLTVMPDGTADEFRPSGTLLGPIGVRLLRIPSEKATVWQSVGTDAIHGTSMIVQGSIYDKDRLDACGTLIEVWKATVTATILGPTKNLDVTASYLVANQMGGLIVADDVHVTGTDAGKVIDQKVQSSISNPVPSPI